MRPLYRNCIIAATFALVALCGLAISYAAPYAPSGDEMVYLTGALEARDHDLPDAYMLQGYDDGPYLYPKILLAWEGTLGYYTFKSIYLVVIIVATGLSAYAMFRLLWLPWMPSLLFAVVALMPRFASGLEIFGTLTFRDAIGRQSATPLFFIATGFLIRRFIEKKSLWPIFGIVGMSVFLHPVTVMLFAFVSLIGLAAARLAERARILAALKEVMICGMVFVLGGSYLFVDIFSRLLPSASAQGVSSADYVQAVLFRNVWDFPQGSSKWFLHMAIVSAFFLAALIAFYFLPRLRSVRTIYRMPHARIFVVWGLAIALGSVVVSVGLPGINLYFMEHANVPYIFQQWSRIAKFYYFGLFVALIPAVYAAWGWYRENPSRLRKSVMALMFVLAVGSSSFFFEVGQFAVGYKNFEPGYVPQSLSHVPDGVTPQEYKEVCQALTALGAAPEPSVISSDFAFRYYCRADLYVTNEEGGAYTQLTRADMVDWYNRLMEQRAALGSDDQEKMYSFARKAGADFLILPLDSRFAALASQPSATTTTRYIIVKVNQSR